ncbi:hypothetical protein H2203_008777 [Taxawa tesnikishii (nom. ined.)]|nr:hypothetical protein H2203_008777 [Dothideales sp. JES 119]
MSSDVPKDFTDFYAVFNKQLPPSNFALVNVIGIATEALAPKRVNSGVVGAAPNCIPELGFKVAYAGDKDLEGTRSNPFQKLSVEERMYVIQFYHDNKSLASPKRTLRNSHARSNGTADNSPPDRALTDPVETEEHDNQAAPKTTCQECHRNFPTEHLTTIHRWERHDPKFSRYLEQGSKAYNCFKHGCTRKFKAVEGRRDHMIQTHDFPPDYDFGLLDTGMEEGFENRYFVEALKDDFPVARARKQVAQAPVPERPMKEVPKKLVPAEPSAASSFGPKFGLIRNVAPDRFCDVLVEVIRMYPGQFDACELYVTDYTTNKHLFDYASPEEEREQGRDGDPLNYIDPHRERQRKWPGPYGQMALKVEVREPHASYARSKIKEGDLVVIRNMRIKTDPQTRIEGNLWPDFRYPDKVLLQVWQVKDRKEVIELLDRKEKYWKGRKRSLSDTEDAKKNSGRQRSVGKGKRPRPEDRSRAGRERKHDFSKPSRHLQKPRREPEHHLLRPLLPTHLPWTLGRRDPTSLRQPETTRHGPGRGFLPPRLEDFARPYSSTLNSQQDPDSDAEGGADPVDVDAQFLLNEDATDISNDSAKLQALRDKLFVLWGDLEEKKSEAQSRGLPSSLPGEVIREDMLSGHAPDNVPFECCIREYGQQVDPEDMSEDTLMGWIRIFEIFETRIK